MGSNGGICVCKEQPPFSDWTLESAKHARAEATLLDEMTRKNGGEPWQLILEQWKGMAWAAVNQAGRRSADGANAVEALRERQAKVQGYRLVESLMDERLYLGRDAAEYLKRAGEREPVPEREREQALSKLIASLNAAAALKHRADAQRALTLIETPGWQVFARRLADRAWAVCWLKTVCPPELGPTLDAMVTAILSPIRALETHIRLGMCAEAWFESQEKKAKEGD